MATVTVRNLPDDLVSRIKERATMNEHSMEQELRDLLLERYPNRKAIIRRIEATRGKLLRPITAAEIDRWKRMGRP